MEWKRLARDALKLHCKWNSSPFSPLRFTPLFWREGLEVDEVSKEPLGRWTRIIFQVSEPSHCQAHIEGRESGRCHLRYLVHGWKVVWKLLMNEMLDFICCISSLGPAADPATAVTDGKQMFNFAWRKHSEIWSLGLRRPFSFVPPQKQIEEGKLHPSNDPARGLNYNRLKPIPCFKDLCNFKRKKIICFKVKFSQLDSFGNYFSRQVLLLPFP